MIPKERIETVSKGPVIVSTSYWRSQRAQQGLLYLSINAATLRLLVPPALLDVIGELPPVGTHCDLVASVQQGRGTYVLTWHDDPVSPYSIEIDQVQCDRPVTSANDGRVMPLIWYVPGDGPDEVREVRRESIQLGEQVAP